MYPDRDRAIAFIRAHDRALADRIEPFEQGEALLTPSLPMVHDLNFLRTDALTDSVRVPELEHEADRLMGAPRLGHRRVNVDDEATAARLTQEFAESGWVHQQFLVMALRREPDREVDLSLTQEVDPGRLRGMRARAIRGWTPDELLVEQILERDRRLLGVTGVRAFAVLQDGEPVSHAYLYCDAPDAPVAQIEDVETLEQHRGNGYARAVVKAAAAAAAGAELVFLVASATDWPQRLYRKLGFDALGTEDRFLKRLS
jgi:ribosomal protein S18 acetylase RimI-like enzyme